MFEKESRLWSLLVLAAIGLGGLLLVDSALRSSGTYDEVTYLELASTWWRTGDQETIARMGSPVTFFKLQQAPVLWMIDRAGLGGLLDDPIVNQRLLLPAVRLGAIWIWVIALVLTALWARQEHGPRAMALAAWLFALSPNLLAHGSLLTMELPLVAGAAGMGLLWSRFVETGQRGWFLATAALGGLVFSCKFTVVLLPPLFALAWWWERWKQKEIKPARLTGRVVAAMVYFAMVMAATNVLVTNGVRIPISEQEGAHPAIEAKLGGWGRSLAAAIVEWPVPQDWAGFVKQVQHQRSGGPSYLMGRRAMHGWWYYYFVCLAAKVPLAVWLLVVGRLFLIEKTTMGDRLALTTIVGVLVLAAIGSSRNFGIRYLLVLAPSAIMWLSALAEGRARARRLALVGVGGMALSVALIHPNELSYFHALVRGPEGGKFLLADSNLDWGQGAKALARLQERTPAYVRMTVFYFGNTDPAIYGVVGQRYLINAVEEQPALPDRLDEVNTPFIAVSRSLQYGPWGPEGYFRKLDAIQPVDITDDHTIAVYRAIDLRGASSPAK